MQFVPMQWGAGDTDRLNDAIEDQLSRGDNVTHILTFNEPDEKYRHGGSEINPKYAAQLWRRDIEPLHALGVKIGAPAITGSERGWKWLAEFFEACDNKCNPDFMTTHYYGDFEGLMDHLGRMTSQWPDKDIWVTEYALPHQDLEKTKDFWSDSSESLNRWS